MTKPQPAPSADEALLAALGRALGARRVILLDGDARIPVPGRGRRWSNRVHPLVVPVGGSGARVVFELDEPPTATDRLVASALVSTLSSHDPPSPVDDDLLDAVTADPQHRLGRVLVATCRAHDAPSGAIVGADDLRSWTWGRGRPALRRAAARARGGAREIQVGGRTFSGAQVVGDDGVAGGVVLEGVGSDQARQLAALVAGLLTEDRGRPVPEPEPDAALQPILASIPIPALLVAPDGRLVGSNPSAEALFEVTDFDLGTRVSGRLRTVAGVDGATDPEVVVRGRRFGLASTVLPDGSRLLLFADRTAETEERAAQERLLAALAHELRTPVVALGTFLELCRNPRLREDESRLARLVDAGEREVHQLTQLVADLRLSARIAGGGIRAEPRPLRIEPLVSEAVAKVALRHPDLDVAVEGDADAIADPELVVHAVRHLVDNAATHARGPVRVRITAGAADATVEVSDSGPGIFSGDLPALFEPFRRLERRATSQHGGGGIGLHLVKAAVEAQGGRVWVRSRLGRGSTFGLSLPAR